MFIITGIPGVGKTTTAVELARRFPNSVHISADDVQHLIINGVVWPDEGLEDEGLRQLELRDKNLIDLANNYQHYGFTPIIDVVLAYENEIDRYITGLKIEPHIIFLDACDDSINARDSTRDKHVTSRWLHLRQPIRDILHHGVCIDNSHLTTKEVVDLIIERCDV